LIHWSSRPATKGSLAFERDADLLVRFPEASLFKIERALALFMVVSWRIGRMMRLGRISPDLPASLMFEPDEIKAAYVLSKKTKPTAPPRLNEVVRRVAAKRVVKFLEGQDMQSYLSNDLVRSAVERQSRPSVIIACASTAGRHPIER
jgi:Transposase Tn5 dimerisation domain